VRPFAEAAWKQISALTVTEPGEPIADSGAGLLCDLELHRPTGLLLDHGRSVPHPPAGTHVVNFQPDEIAASQLAVDRQIEHGKIAPAFLHLEAHSNGPDILRVQRALLADQASLVPRLALMTRSRIFRC
jgi:hypothetical protein